MKWIRSIITGVLLSSPVYAQNIIEEPSQPRSAIEWLSESLKERPEALFSEQSIGIQIRPIETTTLDTQSRNAVGLFSAETAGLPRTAMRASQTGRLLSVLNNLSIPKLPVMASFTERLLLVELDPPKGQTADALFYARLDALLKVGKLDKAQALIERAGPHDIEVFKRWFDISLLTGNDSEACATMIANPSVAPTLPARIFCLSRSDDWAAAALTLSVARGLGQISHDDAQLLAYFLDPALLEEEMPVSLPQQMTPLKFRLLDGIGEPPETHPLPVAFAVADLRQSMGWKARLEASERLARTGAISPEQLRAIYLERQPAASGGVWDRAKAVQSLQQSLVSNSPTGLEDSLPNAWRVFSAAGLDIAFADMYGRALRQTSVENSVQPLALQIGLLSTAYKDFATDAENISQPLDASLQFALAIAQKTSGPSPKTTLERAILDGLEANRLPIRYAVLIAQARLYEALLLGISALENGRTTDPQDITDALTLFKLTGFEDIARRAALQMLLSES